MVLVFIEFSRVGKEQRAAHPREPSGGVSSVGKINSRLAKPSASRPDSPLMTLYFRFHSGPVKVWETLTAFRAHLRCSEYI